VISNPEFESKGMVYSIFLGFNEVADRNIVLYSDILVDQSVIKGLLEKKGDIVLLVDATFRKTRVRNKKLELVICEGQPSGSIRVLDLARKARVLEIGTGVKEKDAHYEFIGVAMISKKAIAAIKKELLSDSSIRDKYSFAELVNYLINSGMEVSAHEVAGGWMEIHDFENYKEACNLFSF
jgi:choline kinase